MTMQEIYDQIIERFRALPGVAELLPDPVQDLHGFVYHLGADAVAPDQCDFIVHVDLLLV